MHNPVTAGASIHLRDAHRMPEFARRVLPGLQNEPQDTWPERLMPAIRSERQRCVEQHWTASVNRLIALRQLYVAARLMRFWSRAASTSIAAEYSL